MKKIFYFIAALALMCACNQEEKNPYRAEMEEFAKKSIPNPETYEFDHMGFEEEHQYISELVDLRLKIQKEMEKPGADVEGYQKLDDKIQYAIDKVGYNIAYYQETLHFWYKGGQTGEMRLPGVVVARYDADRNLMFMTMRPDTLQRYAALQMLKDQGIFDYTESND